MKNIREYFYSLYEQAHSDDDFETVQELEREVYELDDDDFETYCVEHDIDLTVVDERTQELIVTLWNWDMCGE